MGEWATGDGETRMKAKPVMPERLPKSSPIDESDINEVVGVLRSERLTMSAPDIDESDIDEVVAVLRSGRLALGPKAAELERAVASYVGVRHGVAVSSGTAALHLIVKALGI